MTKITLNDRNRSFVDAAVFFAQADKWAVDNCASYKGHTLTDVSDFSPNCDILATYSFSCDVDANWFSLRWIE